jgi:hypothetical protein
MVNTKITHLGGSRKIARSGLGEVRISALGNGTAKPGDLVGVTDATGKVVGTDIGASEMFRGILDDEPTLAEDTAITDGMPCSIIVPQGAHIYAIKCTDPTGAVVSGLQHKASATAGAITGAANTNLNTAGNMCTNHEALANGDTVMLADWL